MLIYYILSRCSACSGTRSTCLENILLKLQKEYAVSDNCQWTFVVKYFKLFSPQQNFIFYFDLFKRCCPEFWKSFHYSPYVVNKFKYHYKLLFVCKKWQLDHIATYFFVLDNTKRTFRVPLRTSPIDVTLSLSKIKLNSSCSIINENFCLQFPKIFQVVPIYYVVPTCSNFLLNKNFFK
jgi:hypothetical protein